MLSYEIFSENCNRVLARMRAACEQCGRAPESVALLPVTKTHPVAAAEYAARFGFNSVGENRVQEAAEKRAQFSATLRWELIGHLQSNKAKHAVETFERIQSVDTPELAKRIDRLAGDAGKIMPVLLQANAGGDPAKFGSADFSSLQQLAETAGALPHLRIDGLMTIPALDADVAVARRAFETLRGWREKLEAQLGRKLPELSMGMSCDLEIAIAAGSTMVRIGTALFGARE